jgi:DNA invertase Pin-like site-specific DNA recombinase
MSKLSLKERISLAQSLGYEILVLDGGNGKIAVVYARVSGPKQAIESVYSLKRQRGLADQAVGMNYSAVIVILADIAGVSGALGPEARPGFQKLYQAIERGIADDVFVLDFTRLVRDKIIGLDFAALCIKNQVTIIDETGRVLDPSDEVGLILYVVELTKSEGERDRINARLQISRRLKASEGKNPGRVIPTGYFVDPSFKKEDPNQGSFQVYEPHRPFVAFVFEKLLEIGYNSPRRILRACRKKGLDRLPPFEPKDLQDYMETRTSLRLTARDEEGNYIVTTTLVGSVANNYEWYAGVFEWATDSEWGPPIRIEDNHPTIIDPALQPSIHRALEAKRRGPCKSHPVLPLAGIVRSFSNEGNPVPLEHNVSTGYAPRYVYNWEYQRSIPGGSTWSLVNHVVDEPIFDIVLNRLILPDYADRVATELETNRSDALEAAARHRASRERLEKEIENLQISFAHVTHPDDIASINEQLTRRREQLEQLAAEAESMIVAQQVMSEQDIETYREFLADLPALWEGADNELRNRFLSIVLEGVYVLPQPTYFDAKIVWYNGEEDVIRVHVPPRYWKRKKWTDDEEEYLRENYETASWRELAERLARKEGAIKLHAFYMGLKRPPSSEPKLEWTEEEIDVLRQYSQSEMSYEEMREALPRRNEEAVYAHMKRLEFPQPTKAYWYHLPQSYGKKFPSYHSAHRNTAAYPTRSASLSDGAACHSTTISCPENYLSTPNTC